jgi:hypothetical protein
MLPARRAWPLAIAVLGAVAVLASCGSGVTGSTAGSSARPSATATPAATPSFSCAQVAALRTVLTNLVGSSVNPGTGGQVSADLTEIETALTALKGQIGTAFSGEAHRVGSELTTIGKHARALAAHPSPANLRATTIAVGQLKTAVAPAIAILRTDCHD